MQKISLCPITLQTALTDSENRKDHILTGQALIVYYSMVSKQHSLVSSLPDNSDEGLYNLGII